MNRASIQVFTDQQQGNETDNCHFLDHRDGRCEEYAQRPFGCDLELVRVMEYADHFRLSQQLPGRGWARRRVDGTRGVLCTLHNSKKGEEEVERKLLRLLDWMNHFGLHTTRISKTIALFPKLRKGTPLTFERNGMRVNETN